MSETVAESQERRRQSRRSANRIAYIVFGRGNDVYEVRLKDVSATGAQIDLDAPIFLPDALTLIDMKNRLLYQCSVLHKHPQTYGLRFVNRHPLDQLPAELRYLSKTLLHLANGGSFKRKR